jgi:hypothetical protein
MSDSNSNSGVIGVCSLLGVLFVNSNSGVIGVCGLLGVLFVGLKLAGVIDWPWWLVASPIFSAVLIYIANEVVP